jgi:acetyl esterase/lipase
VPLSQTGAELLFEIFSYWRHFVPEGATPPDLMNADLAKLPPTLVITAAFDPLHDEGETFARRLAAADVPTEYRDYAGQIHGFLRLSHAIKEARTAQLLIGEFIQRYARAGFSVSLGLP